MVYFVLCLSILKKKPFSASKYAKDMLAYRKGTPYCFMQQATALHEHGGICCSIEIFNEFTCQKHIKRFEACIFSQKYFFELDLVHSFSFNLFFAKLSNLRMLFQNIRLGLCLAYASFLGLFMLLKKSVPHVSFLVITSHEIFVLLV